MESACLVRPSLFERSEALNRENFEGIRRPSFKNVRSMSFWTKVYTVHPCVQRAVTLREAQQESGLSDNAGRQGIC